MLFCYFAIGVQNSFCNWSAKFILQLECMLFCNWNACYFAIGMHVILQLECMSFCNWNACHFAIGMHVILQLECKIHFASLLLIMTFFLERTREHTGTPFLVTFKTPFGVPKINELQLENFPFVLG